MKSVFYKIAKQAVSLDIMEAQFSTIIPSKYSGDLNLTAKKKLRT